MKTLLYVYMIVHGMNSEDLSEESYLKVTPNIMNDSESSDEDILAPIIGILTQETTSLKTCFSDASDYKCYIAASYVKFLESAGARVVPIWIGQDREYYERSVNYTNGILLPGGATYFNESDGYADAARFIYEIAQDSNDNGHFYPILGICLGMEVLAYVSAKGTEDVRVSCDSVKKSLPLTFETDFKSSTLFKNVSDGVLNILKHKNVTYNYHKYCLTEESLRLNQLLDEWRILSRNWDTNGQEFISTMEHKHYPFYGLQFHPEKSRFEFKKTMKIPHNLSCNKASQYFADFFIGQCKNNNNEFPDETIEVNSYIYNFNPKFHCGTCAYFQLYLFSENDVQEHQFL